MIRIGVLTSSRSDYTAYIPLLNALFADKEIQCEIIAFGFHFSEKHGFSISEIEKDGFFVMHKILLEQRDDNEEAISKYAAETSLAFSSFWAKHKSCFDFVFCIGDRYEMHSAVISGIPFGIRFAHLYGGDKTLGAFDDFYRNSMSCASDLHFTSTDACRNRVIELTTNPDKVFVIGLLHSVYLKQIELLAIHVFYKKWDIDLSKRSILISFHPETINPEKNFEYINELEKVINELQNQFQLIITMPNADTFGSLYRKLFQKKQSETPHKIFIVENFGVQSFYTCLKHSLLLLGNTSSGISEAPSFGKYFINVGSRQQGRQLGKNVISCGFKGNQILDAVREGLLLGEYKGDNIYYKENAVEIIINAIKSYKSE